MVFTNPSVVDKVVLEKHMWGNGTIPYVGGNGSISGYGGGATWGLGQGSNNQKNESVARYAIDYGSSKSIYGSSSGAYLAQTSRYGTEVATYSSITGAYGGTLIVTETMLMET